MRLGADADIAIVDLAREHTIDDAKLQSRSKISPWNGRRVKGLPIHTLVRGRFVMKDRALVAGTQGLGPLGAYNPAHAGAGSTPRRKLDADDCRDRRASRQGQRR